MLYRAQFSQTYWCSTFLPSVCSVPLNLCKLTSRAHLTSSIISRINNVPSQRQTFFLNRWNPQVSINRTRTLEYQVNTADSSCMQLLSDGICHSDFLILCDSLLTPSPGGICGPSPGPSPDSRWYHPEALGPTRPHPARQKKIWEHLAQASDFVGKKTSSIVGLLDLKSLVCDQNACLSPMPQRCQEWNFIPTLVEKVSENFWGCVEHVKGLPLSDLVK